jgi:hypothetical protein
MPIKKREAARMVKLVDDLTRVLKYMDDGKVANAKKTIKSIVTKVEKKLAKAPKGAPKKKRVPNAFVAYFKAHLKEVKAELPGKEHTEYMKILSVRYKKDVANAAASAAKAPVPKPAKAPKTPKTKKPRKSKA